MHGIGIVLNPKSRRNLRNPRAAYRLARQLGDNGVVREARSIEELHRIAEDFKNLKIEVLGISGGDGTSSVTLTGFLKVYQGMAMPQIALLRGGTMNTVANSIGTSQGRPEGLLARLVRSYNERSLKPLDNVERHVMKVGNHYGFLFGSGVTVGFLREYYRDPEPSPIVAVQTLARGIGSALIGGETIHRMTAPWTGSVAFPDGTEWPMRDYLTVAAGTIDQVGLNFRPFYRYDRRPNAFQIVGVHATAVQFIPELGRILRAQPMRTDRAFDMLTDRATLISKEARTHYFIDGDLHESGKELEIGIGPRVKIVVIR